jgi:quercetin dioxygenase-like cupin family protein
MTKRKKPATNGSRLAVRAVRGFRWTLCAYEGGQYVHKHDHASPGLSIIVSGSLQEGFARRVFDAHRGYAIIKPPDAAHWDRAGSRGALCLVLELTWPLRFLPSWSEMMDAPRRSGSR